MLDSKPRRWKDLANIVMASCTFISTTLDRPLHPMGLLSSILTDQDGGKTTPAAPRRMPKARSTLLPGTRPQRTRSWTPTCLPCNFTSPKKITTNFKCEWMPPQHFVWVIWQRGQDFDGVDLGRARHCGLVGGFYFYFSQALWLTLLNASSLRKRLTHECCILVNEGVSQSYVRKSVVSLLSIPIMGEGQHPIMPTMPT